MKHLLDLPRGRQKGYIMSEDHKTKIKEGILRNIRNKVVSTRGIQFK